MKITSVRIRKIENGGRLEAVSSVIIDDAIQINDIKIIKGDSGLFLSFPSKKTVTSKRDYVHPISAEVRSEFEKAIFEEYNKTLEQE